MCAFYNSRETLTMWSSGTGFAGVFGYAWVAVGHYILGFTFPSVLLAASSMAVCWMLVFLALLKHPRELDAAGLPSPDPSVRNGASLEMLPPTGTRDGAEGSGAGIGAGWGEAGVSFGGGQGRALEMHSVHEVEERGPERTGSDRERKEESEGEKTMEESGSGRGAGASMVGHERGDLQQWAGGQEKIAVGGACGRREVEGVGDGRGEGAWHGKDEVGRTSPRLGERAEWERGREGSGGVSDGHGGGSRAAEGHIHGVRCV